MGIAKSTLSRWANEQHIDTDIVVAAKEIAVDVRRDVSERMGDLLSDLVDDVHQGLWAGMYSSYEKAVMLGIVADKHVAMRKISDMDNAKNVEVHWPVIQPLSSEQIELERERVRLEHEEKQNQLEDE
jgi:hypothetical protein